MTKTNIRHLRKALKMIHGSQIDSWPDWKVRDFVDRGKKSVEIGKEIASLRAQIKIEKAFGSRDQNQDAFYELCFLRESLFGFSRFASSYNPHHDYLESLESFKRRHFERLY